MRAVLYGAAALAIAALAGPQTLRGAVAAAAAVLFEAAPFAVAGALAARVLRGRPWALAYLGCGCAGGPSARSLPATAASLLLFGPWVAAARFAAALLVARSLRSRTACAAEAAPPLETLAAVAPAALLAGVLSTLSSHLDPARLSPVAAVAAGALLGFGAPCGLGAVAFAGALHARAPLAAAAYLCIAGIADMRAFGSAHARTPHGHDAFAYALLAAALGVVAWRHGDTLVHPVLAPFLAACAALALVAVATHRGARARALRAAPAVMLAGAVAGAPAPEYHASETTLENVFAGERLTFTGTLVHEGHAGALVRYAILCCRADAAPMVVRLQREPAFPPGTWLRADGTIESGGDGYALDARRIEPVAPPADPFVYR